MERWLERYCGKDRTRSGVVGTSREGTKKPAVLAGDVGRLGTEYPRRGLNTGGKAKGKRQAGSEAVPQAVPSLHGEDDQAAELLAIWERLDDAQRAELIDAARRIAGR